MSEQEGPFEGGPEPPRTALVLAGGGARGAYEAGVLVALFEEVLPELPAGFEFDIVSGTSVGAIHAAYVAATAGRPGAERAARIAAPWREMELADVLQLSAGDLLGLPLRALGLRQLRRQLESGSGVVGGLVNLEPLERLVSERVPWEALAENLARGRPGALCVSCTEVHSGRVTLFMDGPLAEPSPWASDPAAKAVRGPIGPDHVRASSAIPFLFPAVRLGPHYYVDGGLRMNTPLSPALRLRAQRVIAIALKHAPGSSAGLPAYPESVITQPAFLLGKVLNALMLDPIETELRQLELVNAWLEAGSDAFGEEFLPRINEAVRRRRGVGYRPVRHVTLRPSQDIGALAARSYREGGRRGLGLLPSLMTAAAVRGVPENEADLLSYLFFDARYTARLVELGRRDTLARKAELLALLGDTGVPLSQKRILAGPARGSTLKPG